MQQTSWLSRPVMPFMLISYFLLLVTPIAGNSYDARVVRQKRSSNGNIRPLHVGENTTTTTTTDELEKRVERIFHRSKGSGLVLFNTTSSATPTANNEINNNNNNNNSNDYHKHNNNRNLPPYRNDGAFIFPDDEFTCPERRQGKTYCTEVPNYMEITKLDRIHPEKFAQFRSYFRDDLIQPQNVTQRINSEPLEEYYCSSSSRLIYPKSAETKESKWLLVVQSDTHKQGILVEQCEKEDKPCRFEESLPRFYKSKCKQHFIFRTMIVLVNNVMKEEQVKMPNCCKCILRNIGSEQ